MIEAQGLTRRYGPFTAVQGISFSVDEGEIVGILGPNGAGKTTTIRMITGFLPPSSGRVTVGGLDLFTEPRKARRQIGYLPENVALYTEMRVREYLAYRAQLEGMKRTPARDAIETTIRRCLLEEVGAPDHRHPVEGLPAARRTRRRQSFTALTSSCWTNPPWVSTPSRSSPSAS